MRVFAGGTQDLEAAAQAMMCCECGVCELFACPMGLSPRRINAEFKKRFRLGNIQYQGPRKVIHDQSLFREFRQVPTPRLASKIGIASYMDLHPGFMGVYTPDQVTIPLSQHIGTPARPTVNPGDIVKAGDCIADIPEKALGARIHASISGVVKTIDPSIIIKRS
jgi:Na+-translocating ferredoxin:NAD+ oxidoreductase RnfC subunit